MDLAAGAEPGSGDPDRRSAAGRLRKGSGCFCGRNSAVYAAADRRGGARDGFADGGDCRAFFGTGIYGRSPDPAVHRAPDGGAYDACSYRTAYGGAYDACPDRGADNTCSYRTAYGASDNAGSYRAADRTSDHACSD